MLFFSKPRSLQELATHESRVYRTFFILWKNSWSQEAGWLPNSKKITHPILKLACLKSFGFVNIRCDFFSKVPWDSSPWKTTNLGKYHHFSPPIWENIAIFLPPIWESIFFGSLFPFAWKSRQKSQNQQDSHAFGWLPCFIRERYSVFSGTEMGGKLFSRVIPGSQAKTIKAE